MSGLDVTLRRLGPDDVEGGMEVLVRAFNELESRMGLTPSFQTFPQARATLEMALHLDPTGSWTAVRTDTRKVVGLAVAYRRGDYVSIGPVAVHPLAQGHGVGRRLVRHLRDVHADAECLALSQAAYNPQAFALYQGEGFRIAYVEVSFAGSPVRAPAPPTAVQTVEGTDRGGEERILDIDRELARIDRGQELRLLARTGRAYVADDGYVLTVPIGPVTGIGPGAAATGATLERLLRAALQDVPAGGIVMRAPANGVAVEMASACGLRPRGLANVMALGRWPDRAGEHVHPVFPEIL